MRYSTLKDGVEGAAMAVVSALDWIGGNKPLVGKTFQYEKRDFPYFIHPYNRTGVNERAVEIPIVRRFLLDLAQTGVNLDTHLLEIGNVYSHYDWTARHTIVDMGEADAIHGVINEDFLTFDTHKRFRAILSISTIEHIGVDDYDDQDRVAMALSKVAKLLTDDGMALITVPIGYNPALDTMIRQGIPRTKVRFMRRVEEHKWEQVAMPEDFATIRYGEPFRNANVVAFVYMRK